MDDRMLGVEARDGDVAVYETCTDEACPAKREGFNHAHLVEVRRDEPDVAENVVPTS